MAISVVEFSHGLAVPFMKLSVSKPECDSKRSEGKERARKRALQRAARHGALGEQEVWATAERLGRKQRGRAEWPENMQRVERESGKKSSERSERESGKQSRKASVTKKPRSVAQRAQRSSFFLLGTGGIVDQQRGEIAHQCLG